MKLTVIGGEKLQAQLRKLPRQFLDATAVGEFNAAQLVMARAKQKAPFEEGTLANSAFVADPRMTQASAVVEMGFGGEAVPYMVAQHENLEYQHPGAKSSNPSGGAGKQAKFLESSVNELARTVQATIAKAVDSFIRTGRLPAMTGPIQKKSAQ